jgi:hypothetical protein
VRRHRSGGPQNLGSTWLADGSSFIDCAWKFVSAAAGVWSAQISRSRSRIPQSIQSIISSLCRLTNSSSSLSRHCDQLYPLYSWSTSSNLTDRNRRGYLRSKMATEPGARVSQAADCQRTLLSSSRLRHLPRCGRHVRLRNFGYDSHHATAA